MKKYNIYHADGSAVFTETEKQHRQLVGSVMAHSLEDAFYLSNNLGKSWNELTPTRSTSIGDVIESDEGFFMVCGVGFKLLDDISFNDSQLNQLEQM